MRAYLRFAAEFLIPLALAVAVVFAITGCSSTTLRHGNRIGLAASTLSIACDWGQTRSSASRGWADHYEANMILGPEPSVRAVDTYMVSAIALNALVWWLLPARARPFLSGGVMARQSMAIANNTRTTAGVCGVSGEPVR